MTKDVKARGRELKQVMRQLVVAREMAEKATKHLQVATAEVERIERVLWAIGSDLDGRP